MASDAEGERGARAGKRRAYIRGTSASVRAFLPLYGALRSWAHVVLRVKCRRQRALVLTYDDGPSPELTNPLIELLGAWNVKATFFPIGRRAEQHPEVVDSLQAAGHEIGIHSYGHLHPWKVPAAAAVEDIEQGYAALARWVRSDGPFRPPHGKLTRATWAALRRRNAAACWWTLDSGDTWATPPSPRLVVEAVARQRGGVVLMHDFDRGPERAAYVLETTRQLLELAAAADMHVTTFSGLLHGGGRWTAAE